MTLDSLAEVHRRVDELVGVTLFTVLQWIPDRQALRRIYSSHPMEYPVGGEKVFSEWPRWLSECVTEHRPCLGPDRAAVREAFYDHELIESLGCGAVINLPVLVVGRAVAILCLLAPPYAYDQASVRRITGLSARIAPVVENHLVEYHRGESS